MKNLNDRVAAVTGAASGIGRALALRLASVGCKVAISDIDAVGLDGTAKLLRDEGADVLATTLDVSDRAAVEAWAAEVNAHFGAAHLVFNNAGVTVVDTLEAISYEDFEWLMSINFWGVVYGSKAFLPYLKAADAGHIVNISSIFGIIAVPSQGAYNASKFAVRGFSECLRQELELEGSHVSVTCVHPGGIDTNIARAARFGSGAARMTTRDEMTQEFAKMARTSPSRAAEIIVDAVRGQRRRVLVGLDARVIDKMQRLLPTGYQRLAVHFAARKAQR